VLGNTNLELNNWIKIYKEIKEENSDRTKRVFIRIRRYLLIKVILSNGSFMYLFEIDKKGKEAYLGFIFNMNKEVDKNTLFDILKQTHNKRGLMKKVSISGYAFKHFIKKGKMVDNLKNAFKKYIKL
jgi:hypothetical protein